MVRLSGTVAVLLPILAFPGCEREGGSVGAKKPSVLLITLDTTRADRIGCYGHRDAETPTLDSLARGGVRFDQAFTQVPLTLPSHTSLLTGTYPATNGVRINGVTATGPGITTLGDVFQARGYRTGAFVSASVMDSAFGLARGFDHYDDDLGLWDATERTGDKVCDAALAWIESAATDPFFAWVHFFDPHKPYDPPEPFRGRHADAYDGEIAFVDSQIRRLLDRLDAAGLRDRTLIVVAGDHGEAFREHGESQHGLFVYDTTMRVPLIFSGDAVSASGLVVREAVGLIDVFPTILELAGIEPVAGVEGASLAEACRTGLMVPRPVYGESYYPYLGYGWAPLRSLTTEQWKYIDAPRPELYDRTSDPGEERNLIADKPAMASALRDDLLSMARQMVPRERGDTPANQAAIQRLETLGYVAGTKAPPLAEGELSLLRDPKDMVGAFVAHGKAVSLLLQEKYEEVVALAEPLVLLSPESDQFRVTLGRAYLELGRLAEAQRAFEASLRLVPDNPRQLWRLGEALLRQGKTAEAIAHFEASLAVSPDFAMAHCGLGDALARQGRAAESLDHYKRAVASAPNLARAHGRLGVAYAQQKQFPLAHGHLRRYVEIEPNSPHALVNLGNVLLQMRRPAEAAEMLEKALVYDPQLVAAHRSLFQALLASGKPGEGLDALRAAHVALPDDVALTLRLAWLLATIRRAELRNPAEAVRLAEEGCSGRPPTADDLVVLAAAYASSGDFSHATETARHALSLADAGGDAAMAQRIRQHLQRYEIGRPYGP